MESTNVTHKYTLGILRLYDEVIIEGRRHVESKDLRPLADDEGEKILEGATAIIASVQGFIVFAQQAVQDLKNSISTILDQPQGGRDDMEAWRVELEYRILNTCTAVRMFEEHVYAEINRKFGKESSQLTAARNAFRQTYDKSFAYRLLYRLRNEIVHGSQSLLQFRCSRWHDPKKPKVHIYTDIGVDLNIEIFVRSNVQASLRNEVAELKCAPDLLIVCLGILPFMEELNLKLTIIISPNIGETSALILDIFNEADAAGGYPTILIKNEKETVRDKSEQDAIHFKFFFFPQYVINRALELRQLGKGALDADNEVPQEGWYS